MKKKRIYLPEKVCADGWHADLILVFGAGLKPDGTPSDMLYDRVCTGAELYLGGAGDVLLLSGSVGENGYDEPEAMWRCAARECGVSEDAVRLDRGGVSTYESIFRARETGMRMILVSQAYHLPRALSLARRMGIDARGVAADRRRYRQMPRYRVREALARAKDAVKVRLRRGKF